MRSLINFDSFHLVAYTWHIRNRQHQSWLVYAMGYIARQYKQQVFKRSHVCRVCASLPIIHSIESSTIPCAKGENILTHYVWRGYGEGMARGWRARSVQENETTKECIRIGERGWYKIKGLPPAYFFLTVRCCFFIPFLDTWNFHIYPETSLTPLHGKCTECVLLLPLQLPVASRATVENHRKMHECILNVQSYVALLGLCCQRNCSNEFRFDDDDDDDFIICAHR